MSLDDEFLEEWNLYYAKQIQEQEDHNARFEEYLPSLFPYDEFNEDEDCEALRAAMKGIGTSEKKIIKILCNRSAEQRLKIQEAYQQYHGRSLLKDLKSELGGSLKKLILSLMKPLPLLLAEAVKEATEGAGTDEDTLIQIFCTRDGESVEAIKSTFEAKYKTDLEEVICKELNGDFEKVLMSVLSTSKYEEESAEDLADELTDDDLDEDKIRINLTGHTFPFLKNVFNIYEETTGETFEKVIEEVCSGDSQNAYKAIYSSCMDCPKFFAECLFKAMKGCGTDETALVRIIVTRCELDLGTIKEKYEEIYEENLYDQIKSEISGDYAKALLTLLGDS